MTQVVCLQRVGTLYNAMVTERPHSYVKLVVGGAAGGSYQGLLISLLVSGQEEFSR